MVLSFVLAVVVVLCSAIVIIWTRSALHLSAAIMGGLAVAAVCAEFLQSTALLVNGTADETLGGETLAAVTMVSFVAVATVIVVLSPRARRFGRADIVVFSVAAGTMLFLIVNRVLASTNVFSPLASLAWLGSGEDNAKWINFASQLATGSPVSVAGGNSGIEAIIVVIGVAFAHVTSQVVLGGDNQVAATALGVVFSHGIVIVLAPLATSPFLYRRSLREPNLGSARSHARGYVIATIVVIAGLLLDVSFGHLTVETVAVVAIYAMGLSLHVGKSNRIWLVVVFLLSSLGSIWLPLNYFSLSVAFAGVALPFVIRRSLSPGEFRWTVALVALNAAMTLYNELPDLGYLSSQSSPSGIPVQSLVVAEGGTPVTDWALILVAVASLTTVAFAVASARKTRVSQTAGNQLKILSVAPVALFVAFCLAIVYYDSWATGSGAHYGSRKIIFLLCLVLIGLCLPPAMDFWAHRSSAPSPAHTALLLVVLFVFSLTGFIPRAVGVASPAAWPQAQLDGWRAAIEVADAPTQPVADMPVGCVFRDAGGFTGGGDAYFCTRQLIAVKGLEQVGSTLLDAIAQEKLPKDPKTIERLQKLDPRVINGQLLVIDAEGQVLDTITVSDFTRALAG